MRSKLFRRLLLPSDDMDGTAWPSCGPADPLGAKYPSDASNSFGEAEPPIGAGNTRRGSSATDVGCHDADQITCAFEVNAGLDLTDGTKAVD